MLSLLNEHLPLGVTDVADHGLKSLVDQQVELSGARGWPKAKKDGFEILKENGSGLPDTLFR